MVFQKLNGFHKAARGGRHNQINGIEVEPAIKTSGQVGLRICRRMKSVANRTAESEDFFTRSPLKSQPVDDQININVIAKPFQETIGVWTHNSASLRFEFARACRGENIVQTPYIKFRQMLLQTRWNLIY